MIKTFHHKLLILQLILHIASFVGLYIYWDPVFLLFTLFGKYIFSNLGLEIGYHRLLAHRSFKTSIIKENILTILGTFGGFGPSLTWTANHRVHHKYSDRNGDPHPASDLLKTLFWLNDKVPVSPSVVKDLLKNPIHKWQRDHYFKMWACFTIFLIIAINTKFTLYFLIIPGALGILSGAAINIWNHKYGYRNFNTEDNSTNSWLINIYATGGGSGWHNNHHANPGSYTTRVKWWELDLDGFIIKHFIKN